MRDIRPAVVNIVNPGFQSDRAMGENCLIRHHLIIAGTGRAGTSLLVKILNACGLETELNRGNGYFWDDRANAGIETLPLAGQEHPYVIKSPWTYQFLDELLSRKDVRIDGLIVPVRDLREAAASRIVIELQNMHRSAPEFDELLAGWRDWGLTPGGVTYSLEPVDQARILGQSLHLLLERALEHEIPICLVKFPKFAHDPMYLYRNLTPFISRRVDGTQFEAIFHSIVSPEPIRVSSELAEPADGLAAISTVADAGAQLPSLERLENVALTRELHAKRLEITQASIEIGTLTARCTGLEAELAAASKKADLLRSERDDDIERRAATEAALRADIEQRAATEAALRNAVEQAEREAKDWGASAEAAQAHNAAMRPELANAKCRLNRRAAEVAALQTEFEILRGTLAVAERDAREHAAAAEILQGEIASLQAQLATAQSEARECVAAAAVMQREIASVRSELAVARTIGRAALAVLRTSSVPILEAHAAKRSQLVAGLLARTWLTFGLSHRPQPVIADG